MDFINLFVHISEKQEERTSPNEMYVSTIINPGHLLSLYSNIAIGGYHLKKKVSNDDTIT